MFFDIPFLGLSLLLLMIILAAFVQFLALVGFPAAIVSLIFVKSDTRAKTIRKSILICVFIVFFFSWISMGLDFVKDALDWLHIIFAHGGC